MLTVEIYRFVVVLKWILVMLAVILCAYAVQAWWRGRPAREPVEGSYGHRLAVWSRTTNPRLRYLGLWWVPVLLAGGLQWLLGWDSPAGQLNLIGWLALIAALAVARRHVKKAQKDTAQPATVTRRAIRLRLTSLALLLGVTLLTWLAGALYNRPYQPHSADLRAFDPEAVAHLETAMWRSYYDKQRLRLFLQLRELIGTQYRFPRLASFHEAYLATRAAFTFKVGKERGDYEKALPYLERYYEEIARIGNLAFDPKRLAALELEWWIVHRQEDRYSLDDLSTACARLMAELYRADLDRLMEHGRLRAEAMKIRDRQAGGGSLAERDWVQIEALLRRAYRSLHEVVSQPTPGKG